MGFLESFADAVVAGSSILSGRVEWPCNRGNGRGERRGKFGQTNISDRQQRVPFENTRLRAPRRSASMLHLPSLSIRPRLSGSRVTFVPIRCLAIRFVIVEQIRDAVRYSTDDTRK